MKEFLLLLHPTLGSLGILATVWTAIEVWNASSANYARIKFASATAAVLMVLTWIAAGYWYVVYYAADKAIILAGPWPFAHNFFMESKEHAFFITLVLALFLPIAVYTNNLVTNRAARIVVLWTAVLIALSAFAIEGAGSIIAMGVRVGLMQSLGQ